MEALLLAFISGNFLANVFPTLLSVNECVVTIAIILVLLQQGLFRAAACLIGFVTVSVAMILQLAWQPTQLDISTDINITGRVSTLVKSEKQQVRFNLLLDCVQNPSLGSIQTPALSKDTCPEPLQEKFQETAQSFLIKPKVRLTWYQPEWVVKQGQLLSLSVRLKPPHGVHNAAGFDYQRWLISEAIVATGYVKQIKLIGTDIDWRQSTFDYLQQQFANLTHKDLMIGLLMGERSLMESSRWDVLKQTGTAHLLAVSGLHLGLVFIWCYWLLRLLLRPFAYLLTSNLDNLALIVAIVITWLFCALTGFSLPGIRAAIFISCFALFGLLGWHIGLACRFLFAVSLVLIALPTSPLSLSFWLSFYAAGFIVFLLWYFKWHLKLKRWDKLKRFILLQLWLSIGLIPIQILFFQHLPYLSIVANLIAIPLLSLVVLPSLLLAGGLDFFVIQLETLTWFDLELLKRLVDIGYQLSHVLLDILWQWLYLIAQLDLATASVSSKYLKFLWFFVIALLLLKLPMSKKTTCYLLTIPISFLLLALAHPKKLYWQLDMLDVGQGLAVLITRDQQSILYDTGDAYRSGFNLFEAVVEPNLTELNSDLIGVVVSHADKDHAGGLNVIREKYPNLPIWQGQHGCADFAKMNKLGLNWQYLPVMDKQAGIDSNNSSCVFKVTGLNHSVLLTGDIEKETEKNLLKNYAHLLPSDVLLVPHHGSKTSSTLEFINQVNPKISLNSAGLFNRFGHPSSEIEKRYQQQQVLFLNTATQGQIQIQFKADSILWGTYTKNLWRPWHSKIWRSANSYF